MANGTTFRTPPLSVPKGWFGTSYELRAVASGPCNLAIKVRGGNQNVDPLVDRDYSAPAAFASMVADTEVSTIITQGADTLWQQLEFTPTGADVLITLIGSVGGINAVSV